MRLDHSYVRQCPTVSLKVWLRRYDAAWQQCVDQLPGRTAAARGALAREIDSYLPLLARISPECSLYPNRLYVDGWSPEAAAVARAIIGCRFHRGFTWSASCLGLAALPAIVLFWVGFASSAGGLLAAAVAVPVLAAGLSVRYGVKFLPLDQRARALFEKALDEQERSAGHNGPAPV
jgi:hypothetical protein